ncbi:isopentenyl-diphosphate delta-isomerase [Austwickia chelonae]|uniref:Isopentenyl-diphosphate Delta-isomerase n=1 Tax=Austwickia chelonae NBRC 105200 TaxID=1184607 RepID=K6VV93_9MICO|nr:isopentenyl-diphosphate Delta-isomerase [Austwickia chelonae]GAB79265.1 isopentenyl-diphosphate Delta-isomerase [Austwickia chelonae NBRC 105200]SEW37732.1 isopentenyl-diphosphate delta-isomerase [Austwickia chelonae]
MTRQIESDEVVLIGPDGQPAGTADRLLVHGADTPLHLAFSVYLLDGEGRLLMTRRALSKRTWPGVWSNSCCGHPRPGEQVADAVLRRTFEETGLDIDQLTCVLPEFTYRAVDAGGIVEYELCPVFVGRARGDLTPDPAEIEETAWAEPAEVQVIARSTPFVLSPWCVRQLALLDLDAASAALRVDGPSLGRRGRPGPVAGRTGTTRGEDG